MLVEPHAALADTHASDVTIRRNVLVADTSVGCSHLEIVEPVIGPFHELLITDAPCSRNRWEEAETIVLGKLAASVVTAVDLNEIASEVVVGQTSEGTADGIFRSTLDKGLLACTALYRWHRRYCLSQHLSVEIGVEVVFLVETCHKAEAMSFPLHIVVGEEVERIVLRGRTILLVNVLTLGW